MAFELVQPENQAMSDFLKCECPHCGQSVEYPAEGSGETVPCPTCKKQFTLTPTKPTPLPESERGLSCYNRPATKEQLAELRRINKHSRRDIDEPYYDIENDGPLTYGEAKELIRDRELFTRQNEQQQILNSDLSTGDSGPPPVCHFWDDEYEKSERGRFDGACLAIEDGWQFDKHGDLPTRKQVAQAWELVKSRKSNKAKLPTHSELVAALKELFPKSRSEN